MRRALRLHPHSRCLAATHIEVEVQRPRAGSLVLHYVVSGKMTDLRIAPVTAIARTDGLWRRTCFEAFIRATPGAAYYEFNFAPSTQWAAYRFDSYRGGMRVATEISAPRIEVQSDLACYVLQASLELSQLSLPRNFVWQLGLSAVIEEKSRRKSYWALVHAPGKPDFHHSDCFAHEFSPGWRL